MSRLRICQLITELQPAGAERVTIAGPDVREAQVAAGKATVFFRGKITGHTSLSVNYELPAAAGAAAVARPATRSARRCSSDGAARSTERRRHPCRATSAATASRTSP